MDSWEIKMQPYSQTSYAQELVELVHFSRSLPLSETDREKMDRILERLNARITQRNSALQLCKNILEDMRLDAECLLFDVEATRRERDEYRQELVDLRRMIGE